MVQLKINYYFENPIPFIKINNLFKETFNRELDQRYWDWRFIQNPNSPKIYINYINSGKDLAAYYAVSPNILETQNGGNYNVALSNMTMVNPIFQKYGYFVSLANDLYKILINDGYIGIYGFANHNSHYGFRKYLNWHDLCILNIMCLKKNDIKFKFNQIKLNLSFLRSIITKDDLKRTKNFIFSKSKINLTRNSSNLNWRLMENPVNLYNKLQIFCNEILIGIIFYKKYLDINIDILEIFISPDFMEHREEILARAMKHFQEEITGNINIWSNLYSEEHLILEKIGFLETYFNTYFGFIPFINDSDLRNILLDIKNWHYRFFDSDLF